MPNSAEQEAERFLLSIIKTSPFSGKVFVVGGYTRDQFMGKMPKDLDIMVEMDGGAERLAKWLHDHFPGSISNAHQKGAGYPIWAVVFQGDVEWRGVTYQTKGAELEFADSQKEMFPDPNSRQRITQFGTKEEDTARRDFTVKTNHTYTTLYIPPGCSCQQGGRHECGCVPHLLQGNGTIEQHAHPAAWAYG